MSQPAQYQFTREDIEAAGRVFEYIRELKPLIRERQAAKKAEEEKDKDPRKGH